MTLGAASRQRRASAEVAKSPVATATAAFRPSRSLASGEPRIAGSGDPAPITSD